MRLSLHHKISAPDSAALCAAARPHGARGTTSYRWKPRRAGGFAARLQRLVSHALHGEVHLLVRIGQRAAHNRVVPQLHHNAARHRSLMHRRVGTRTGQDKGGRPSEGEGTAHRVP